MCQRVSFLRLIYDAWKTPYIVWRAHGRARYTAWTLWRCWFITLQRIKRLEYIKHHKRQVKYTKCVFIDIYSLLTPVVSKRAVFRFHWGYDARCLIAPIVRSKGFLGFVAGTIGALRCFLRAWIRWITAPMWQILFKAVLRRVFNEKNTGDFLRKTLVCICALSVNWIIKKS